MLKVTADIMEITRKDKDLTKCGSNTIYNTMLTGLLWMMTMTASNTHCMGRTGHGDPPHYVQVHGKPHK